MAIKFVDRVPTYPGRIKFTKEDGTVVYGVWERADSPTVEGTPLNAATFNAMQSEGGMSANTQLYVSASGSDTTGTGTQSAPYASVNKALSVLPKNLGGYTATITVLAGSYTGDITINGFNGGALVIGGTATAANQVVTGAVTITNCTASVKVQYMSFQSTSSGSGEKATVFYIENCQSIYLLTCKINGGSMRRWGVTLIGCRAFIETCDFDALVDGGIRCGSTLLKYPTQCTLGINNATASVPVYCSATGGGMVFLGVDWDTSAQTQYSAGYGGRIFGASQATVPAT